ncbi:MAG: ribokinase [Acidimicrobiaceae bacterium]|nr:ribokinase [Acidimicrobiaceae bacterium]
MRVHESEVVVVGSINLDFVVEVERIPTAGETVRGSDLRYIPGGKGANQAVASARLGRSTALIGRVGYDNSGALLKQSVKSAGVATEGLMTTPGMPSGSALIAVDASGDNAIVVSPGSNGKLSAADVKQHSNLLSTASVVLLQLEVPVEAVAAAVQCASSSIVILNPAPAPEEPLPNALLEQVDLLIPNQTEVAKLAGYDSPSDSDPVIDRSTAVQLARKLPTKAVIVTLGANGAAVVTDTESTHIPAPKVTALDTTGAGDAFCAALADALIDNASLTEATRWATQVGAATTMRAGAQPSLPTTAEVKELLKGDH